MDSKSFRLNQSLDDNLWMVKPVSRAFNRTLTELVDDTLFFIIIIILFIFFANVLFQHFDGLSTLLETLQKKKTLSLRLRPASICIAFNSNDAL